MFILSPLFSFDIFMQTKLVVHQILKSKTKDPFRISYFSLYVLQVNITECLSEGVSDKGEDHQGQSSSFSSSSDTVCEIQNRKTKNVSILREIKIKKRRTRVKDKKNLMLKGVRRPSSLWFEVTVNTRPSRTVAPLSSLIILFFRIL